MKTATIRIIDGKYIDQYALGEIDRTHLFLKRYEGHEAPGADLIKEGHVYHVAQLKGTAQGLYEAVEEWLSGIRDLINAGFESR